VLRCSTCILVQLRSYTGIFARNICRSSMTAAAEVCERLACMHKRCTYACILLVQAHEMASLLDDSHILISIRFKIFSNRQKNVRCFAILTTISDCTTLLHATLCICCTNLHLAHTGLHWRVLYCHATCQKACCYGHS
jgi:hypothetical protein